MITGVSQNDSSHKSANSDPSVCRFLDNTGQECGECDNLSIIHNFRNVYELMLRRLNDGCYGANPKQIVDIQRHWIDDLNDLMEMMTGVIVHLEEEAVNKVEHSKKCNAEPTQALEEKMQRLTTDISGLLELIRRVRANNCWCLDGITFCDITHVDIFGKDAADIQPLTKLTASKLSWDLPLKRENALMFTPSILTCEKYPSEMDQEPCKRPLTQLHGEKKSPTVDMAIPQHDDAYEIRRKKPKKNVVSWSETQWSDNVKECDIKRQTHSGVSHTSTMIKHNSNKRTSKSQPNNSKVIFLNENDGYKSSINASFKTEGCQTVECEQRDNHCQMSGSFDLYRSTSCIQTCMEKCSKLSTSLCNSSYTEIINPSPVY